MPDYPKSLKPRQAVTIGEVIRQSGKWLHLDAELNIQSIRSAWPELAGVAVSARTQPDFYRDRILYLKVADSTWMNELTYYKEELLTRLRVRFPEHTFDDIHLRLGKISGRFHHPRHPHARKLKRTLTPEENDFIDRLLKDIRSNELKEILYELLSLHFRILSSE